MPAERTDEDIAREILSCAPVAGNTFSERNAARRELARAISDALRTARAEAEAAEREACARMLDQRVQSLQAALTGEPNDINARIHACIHNLRQCAAAIRARSAPREGEG